MRSRHGDIEVVVPGDEPMFTDGSEHGAGCEGVLESMRTTERIEDLEHVKQGQLNLPEAEIPYVFDRCLRVRVLTANRFR